MGKYSQSEELYFDITRSSRFLSLFICPTLYKEFFTLYIQLFSDHLNPTLVVHLRLHLSVYPISHLFWFFVSCSNQSITVQMSSPHKCGQGSDYSAFNAVTSTFPQIFWVFSHSFQIHRTRLPLLSFLEGSSSCWDANLRYASHVREGFHPRTSFHVLLTYGALCWAFTMY